MACPIVAVVGCTGYVGKHLMPPFLEGINSQKLKELRILTSEEKEKSEIIQNYVKSGAKAFAVSYDDPKGVTAALSGVDIVVSTLGTGGDNVEQVKSVLLDAMVAAQVKVYFPSEFGTNHYKIKEPLYANHAVFKGKRDHFLEAQKRGLNPKRMLIGDILEASFGKWFGLDCNKNVWSVVGQEAADIPCAMTAERDIGKFTLEAVLLSYKDVTGLPDNLEVYSDIRSLREYAKVFDSVSGKITNFYFLPKEPFQKEFEETGIFEKLIMLMFAEGIYDYSASKTNSILNPGESLWKLKKVEEYAEEVSGIPWKK